MNEIHRPVVCPQCGHAVRPEARFCPECGAPILGHPAPPTIVLPPDPLDVPSPYRPSVPDPSAHRSPHHRLFWIWIGSVGCLSLIVIGACMMTAFALVHRSERTLIPTGTTITTGTDDAEREPDGEIVFRDDFTNPTASRFKTDENDSVRFSFEQGSYVIELKESETMVWVLADGIYRDAVIEARYTIPRNGPDGAVGIVFRYQDADNFYFFGVSNDGFYALKRLTNDRWDTLIDWTRHHAVRSDTNHIRVVMRGTEISLLLNHQHVARVRDSTFLQGAVGIAAMSLDHGGVIARYDELTIWQR